MKFQYLVAELILTSQQTLGVCNLFRVYLATCLSREIVYMLFSSGIFLAHSLEDVNST